MTLTRRQIDTLMRQRQITRREAAKELAAVRQRDKARRAYEATPEGKEALNDAEIIRRPHIF